MFLDSIRVEDSDPEQVEAGAAIHLPLDEFESVDVSFDGSIAPGQFECCEHGILVAKKAASEAVQRGVFGRLKVLHLATPTPLQPKTIQEDVRKITDQRLLQPLFDLQSACRSSGSDRSRSRPTPAYPIVPA